MPVLEKETPEAFQSQVDRVRAGMQPGGRFEYIEGANRDRVNADLDTMSGMIRANGSVAAMKPEDKKQLIDIEERVNAILTRSDSNHMVCEKVQQPGSLLRVATCHTFGELRKRQLDGQNETEKAAKHADAP
ncbi:MAG TPA: hypothetical protein VFB32_11765 [Rudaea sp.]|nr:hypothetical protein [Rudaea sp.]